MKKYHVTCSLGHRLFDVSEGSNMRIRIKCANQKTCSHKAVCLKWTEIIFGEGCDLNSGFEDYSCPNCSKRLFDAAVGSTGEVQIKCGNCGKVIQISVGVYRLRRQAVC